ncbi:hypothetical protein GUY44_07195 [Pimelobacter simplex]|uniref:Uncharacterized protein n=1 Tax=Nocardioides simplex TaxID=2045 RepID=A0A0A1DK49_NOCSI|nr:hypothetical protein [Pimelobacter simplex]AIY17791.1 hypothetical protein KR76_15300 [Pimelobacter simplex]MCG8150258.1 hypothetical protein [Pimelobacter simplex]GEB13532.1 hypothetical protein NSI01_18470 [Pimelobacter simplex]SFM72114.1 hypothetical protein SAMN05421671_3139 [Pimelobacter simplex]
MSTPTERPVLAAWVRIFAANLAFTTGWRKDKRHLLHLLATVAYGVVIGAQEAKNINLAALVGKAARALQRTTNPAVAGSAIIGRGVRLRRFRLVLGALSRATLPRYIARSQASIDGEWVRVFSAHAPPRRAGRAAQDRFLARLKKLTDRAERNGHAWIVCIDGNRDLQAIARHLGGTGYGARGDRIVGVIVSDRVIVADHGVDRYGVAHKLTDHLAPYVDVAGLRPHRRRTPVR